MGGDGSDIRLIYIEYGPTFVFPQIAKQRNMPRARMRPTFPCIHFLTRNAVSYRPDTFSSERIMGARDHGIVQPRQLLWYRLRSSLFYYLENVTWGTET